MRHQRQCGGHLDVKAVNLDVADISGDGEMERWREYQDGAVSHGLVTASDNVVLVFSGHMYVRQYSRDEKIGKKDFYDKFNDMASIDTSATLQLF